MILLGFNLIPAFPLDGGRIARAAAWRITGDRTKATRFSARIGQGFAVLLIGYGLYQLLIGDVTSGLWPLAVLGWLLGGCGAPRGGCRASFTERIEGITVADIMDAEPVTIPADIDARCAPTRTTSCATTAGSGSRWSTPTAGTSGFAHRWGRWEHAAHEEGGATGRSRDSVVARWATARPRSVPTRRSRRCCPPSRCGGSAR